jgi:hypothetical protein
MLAALLVVCTTSSTLLLKSKALGQFLIELLHGIVPSFLKYCRARGWVVYQKLNTPAVSFVCLPSTGLLLHDGLHYYWLHYNWLSTSTPVAFTTEILALTQIRMDAAGTSCM